MFQLDVELDGVAFQYRLDVEHHRRERRARIVLETLSKNEGPLFSFERGDVQLYRDDHSKGATFKGDWRESGLARVVPIEKNRALTRFLEFMRGVLVCRLNPPALPSGRSASIHGCCPRSSVRLMRPTNTDSTNCPMGNAL